MKFLVYSQAWIALLAGSLAWVSTFSISGDPDLLPIHGLISLTTFSLYGWHKIFAYSKANSEYKLLERYSFVASYPTASKILYTAVAIIALYWYLTGSFSFPLLLGLFGLGLAVFYVLPRVVSQLAGLRSSYIKPFVIASAWAIVTALLPTLQIEPDLNPLQLCLLFGERFGHTLMVAFCFDWRDREMDEKSGLKNWSTKSFENNIIACFLALLIAFVCRYSIPNDNLIAAITKLGILPGYWVAMAFSARIEDYFSDFTYDFWYNGILGLPAVGLIILVLL
ncbi:MAG: hypothetical protein AAFN65_05460 [Bacteroidota bacterium]